MYPRKVGDFLYQVDLADDQANMGVLIFFSRVVEDTHVSAELHQFLIGVGNCHVVHLPGQSAGEVTDFDRHLSFEL